jgi:hypothetical protein
MKSKTRKEINKIIDSLMIELDTETTIATKVFAIAHHRRFLDCIEATPELGVKIKRGADGEIEEVISVDDLATLIKNRVKWSFQNMKDENGHQMFHCFSTKPQTGESNYVPPPEPKLPIPSF